ncbi:MAG: DUF3276 family protein [Bacteroidetes bacterium]|nr:DUF3276 family protein [Bacteroidota bacterium]MBS1684313.1 DUF3276 family protein [Bacteroidota bacterium]
MEKQDKDLYGEKVPAGKRTYFLDFKEKHNGDHVIKITESRKNGEEFIRSTVMIFQEDFDKFFEALDKVRAQIGQH